MTRQHVKRKGPGRREYDGKRCPFHESHEKQLEGLAADMKRKVGLKTLALLVTTVIGVGGIVSGISYMAISRYVETATSSAVMLLKNHIVKSEDQLENITNQLDNMNSLNRIIIYRLNKLDKTPEYPVGPGSYPDARLLHERNF